MEDIWSIILSFIPFKSAYEYKAICRHWNILLSSLSYWKSYCKNKCITSDKNWENDARYAWVFTLEQNRKKFIPAKAIEKYQQGMNYYDLLNYEQASQFFKEAMEVHPNYSETIIKLAECYRIMGMCKEAEDLCNQVLKADKFFPKTYVAMADVCLKTNNYFDGLKLITFYIFLCPDDPDAFNTKGRLHYRLNQYVLSIENYSKAINLRGNDWEFFNNRGLAFQEMHKYEEALEDYAEALKRPCNKQRIYTNRGWCYYKMKLYDKAIEEYNSCLVIDPKNTTALRDRSLAYQGKLLWDNAINDINAAISINPLQNQGLLDLGNLYYNKNEFEKALEYYEKAVVQDIKNPTIYNNMSASFIKLKQYDRAIHYADIVLDIDRNFQTALKHKAFALYHLGNNGEALINVSRAIELSSNYWEAFYVRALVYKSLQVYTKSMEDVLVSLSFNDTDQDSIHLKSELIQILGLAASN